MLIIYFHNFLFHAQYINIKTFVFFGKIEQSCEGCYPLTSNQDFSYNRTQGSLYTKVLESNPRQSSVYTPHCHTFHDLEGDDPTIFSVLHVTN